MNISIIDSSNYFKGLLLLIRRDRRITESEMTLMKHIGKTLGFEREFCENTINQVLENKYILDELPEFSGKELAQMFIKDGLAIACSDKEVHKSEVEWLSEIAYKHDIDFAWFDTEKEKAESRKEQPSRFEADILNLA